MKCALSCYVGEACAFEAELCGVVFAIHLAWKFGGGLVGWKVIALSSLVCLLQVVVKVPWRDRQAWMKTLCVVKNMNFHM